MRTLISHHTLPFHHSEMLSRGQMRGLMALKKLIMTHHKISDPAAIFPWRKCQKSGGMQRIHDGKARSGRAMA